LSWLLSVFCVAVLSLAAPAPAPAHAASGDQSIAEWSIGALAESKARIESLAADLAQAPGETREMTDQTRKALMSGTGVRGFTYLLILLLVGSATEWLYWTYAYAPLRALQSTTVQTPREALRAGLRRLTCGYGPVSAACESRCGPSDRRRPSDTASAANGRQG